MGVCNSKRVVPVAYKTSVQDIEFIATRCVVCLNEPLNVCLFPCAHLCLCTVCVEKLKQQKCPICREGIVSWKRVFIPISSRRILDGSRRCTNFANTW